jgi:hypothetical protein
MVKDGFEGVCTKLEEEKEETAKLRKLLEEEKEKTAKLRKLLAEQTEKTAEFQKSLAEQIAELQQQSQSFGAKGLLCISGNYALRLLIKSQEPGRSHQEYAEIINKVSRIKNLENTLKKNLNEKNFDNNTQAKQDLMNEIPASEYRFESIKYAALAGLPGSIKNLMQLPQDPLFNQLRLDVLRTLSDNALCIRVPNLADRAKKAYSQILLMHEAGYQPATAKIPEIERLLGLIRTGLVRCHSH